MGIESSLRVAAGARAVTTAPRRSAEEIAKLSDSITVHGYVPPDVAPATAAAKWEKRDKIVAHIEQTRAEEKAQLESLMQVLQQPGRPAGAVSGLTLPDMYALKAYHGGIHNVRSLGSDVINQTVEMARAVQRKDVGIIVSDLPTKAVTLLQQELRLRGAEPRLIRTKGATYEDGKMFDDAGKEIKMPEAATPRGAKSYRAVEHVGNSGAFMLNDKPAIALSSSKSATHEIFVAGDVPTFEGTPHIKSFDELRAAADRHQFPLVVKEDVSSGGKGVFIAKDEADLKSIWEGVSKQRGGKGVVLEAQRFYPKPAELAEQGLPIEARLTTVNDVYDRPRVVGGYWRNGANKGDIRENGPNGSEFTRIRVSENDPTLSERAVDGILRAHESFPGQLRSGGGDMRITDEGEKIIEFNPSGIPPDLDVFLPRQEQVLSAQADLLVWGSQRNRELLR